MQTSVVISKFKTILFYQTCQCIFNIFKLYHIWYYAYDIFNIFKLHHIYYYGYNIFNIYKLHYIWYYNYNIFNIFKLYHVWYYNHNTLCSPWNAHFKSYIFQVSVIGNITFIATIISSYVLLCYYWPFGNQAY